MPVALSTRDFRLAVAICEVRYEDSYLLYDNTGKICYELKPSFPKLRVISPAPSQTTGTSDLGSFGLEVNASRFNTNQPDNKLEQFASSCRHFFDVVGRNLDVKVFTRIGLRTIFRKDYSTLDDAKAAFTALNLVPLEKTMRFGAATEPLELLWRWEGNDVGATWRLKAESGKIDLILPPELEAEVPEVHKVTNGLILDVDYYTLAPVDRSQWNPVEWIPHAVRIVKRDSDTLLGS